MMAADGDYVEREKQWYVVVSDFTDERDLMYLMPYDSPEAAQTCPAQTFAHPQRRPGIWVETLDHSAQIHRARIRLGHRDGQRCRARSGNRAPGWLRQLGTCQRRQFAGHAAHTEAIAPVGRQIDLQHMAIE